MSEISRIREKLTAAIYYLDEKGRQSEYPHSRIISNTYWQAVRGEIQEASVLLDQLEESNA